ncbi:MAG: CsgG/HfaB family protein [Myxococcota bacterium]
MRWGAAVAVVGLAGCSFLTIPPSNMMMSQSMREADARGAVVEVVRPEQLATVRTLAVPPFRDSSWTPGNELEVFRDDSAMRGRMFFPHRAAGEQIAERFEEYFLATKVVDVVERSRLAAVLQEQALGPTDGTKGGQEMLPEVSAGLAGADAVLLGSTTSAFHYVGDRPGVYQMAQIGVHVRLVDKRSGQILAWGEDTAAEASAYVDDQDLITRLATRLTRKVADAILAARKQFPQQAAPERAPHMMPSPPRANPG